MPFKCANCEAWLFCFTELSGGRKTDEKSDTAESFQRGDMDLNSDALKTWSERKDWWSGYWGHAVVLNPFSPNKSSVAIQSNKQWSQEFVLCLLGEGVTF